MRLGDLLPGGGMASDLLKQDIVAITADSRKVVPGALFFAVPGTTADGLSFAEEAARKGAVAIVADRAPASPLPVPLIGVTDVRAELAHAAARLHPRQPATSSPLSPERAARRPWPPSCARSGKRAVGKPPRSARSAS